MRSLCIWLAGAFLTCAVIGFAPGCGGSEGLEKPADPTKKVDPMKDMPGYKEMQDQLKAKKK